MPVFHKPNNIYPSAKFGKDVNVGAFVEIGHNVKIGDRVRVGAFSFICEGVTIEDDVFIGPRVTFSNDMYPPSPKKDWRPTLVKKGARLGAGVMVVPGITIGENALIGMGSVVTHDVPAGAKICGNPAHVMKLKIA